MRYSKRLEALPQYPFLEMEKAIAERRRRGLQVITFGIGDPDYPPPDFVNEALSEGLRIHGNHNYSTSEGELFFREAVAEWFQKRFNVQVDPQREVCALIGSKEGLANIARAIIDPSERVLVPNPSYPVYLQGGGILNDAAPVDILLGSATGFKPDVDEIRKQRFRLVFLNYPNNPTGAVADETFLLEVLKAVEEKDAYLCYDNAYSEITFGGFRAPSILQLPAAKERAIEFHSFSKTFNMTGYRIGFAVGNSDLITGLKRVKSQIDSGSPKFIQHAAAHALREYKGQNPPLEVVELIKRYERRMAILVRGLRGLGYRAEMPMGTFYLWLQIDEPSRSFASKLLENGVVVTPGVGFGTNGEGYVRFSLTLPEEQIEMAIEQMRNLVK